MKAALVETMEMSEEKPFEIKICKQKDKKGQIESTEDMTVQMDNNHKVTSDDNDKSEVNEAKRIQDVNGLKNINDVANDISESEEAELVEDIAKTSDKGTSDESMLQKDDENDEDLELGTSDESKLQNEDKNKLQNEDENSQDKEREKDDLPNGVKSREAENVECQEKLLAGQDSNSAAEESPEKEEKSPDVIEKDEGEEDQSSRSKSSSDEPTAECLAKENLEPDASSQANGPVNVEKIVSREESNQERTGKDDQSHSKSSSDELTAELQAEENIENDSTSRSNEPVNKEEIHKEQTEEADGFKNKESASDTAAADCPDLEESESEPKRSEEDSNDKNDETAMDVGEEQKDSDIEELTVQTSKNEKTYVNTISIHPVNNETEEDDADTDTEEENEKNINEIEEQTVMPSEDNEHMKKNVQNDVEIEESNSEISTSNEGESRVAVDYDKALSEIKKIDENHEMMENELISGKMKRPAELDDQPVMKRLKIDSNGEVGKKFKKQLKKMNRKHLENLLAEKLVESCVNRSELGIIRKQCDSYKESTDLWQRRAEALSKQVKDLSTVIKKYILETKNKSTRTKQGPLRITRSVGLQVVPQMKRQNSRINGHPVRMKAKQINPMKPNVPNPGAPKRPAPNPVRPLLATPRPIVPAVSVVQNPPRQIQSIPPAPEPKLVKLPEIVEIDLSDDESQGNNSVPVSRPIPLKLQKHPQQRANTIVVAKPVSSLFRHPAPLPNEKPPYNPQLKDVPPKPTLSITKGNEGVVLSWNMVLNVLHHATVSSYQLFAYQETNQKPDRSLWKKVGDIKALPLPMACTLKQFSPGNKYHFSVRALDTYKRQGQFSEPASIQI